MSVLGNPITIGSGGGGTMQSKSVTYTENGTDVVTPDSGYDGLSSVTVVTNVSGGGATASIVVSSETGVTITDCTATTPRGIVLQGVQVGSTWVFSGLSVFGTYVVTATDGTNTKTVNVLVDEIGQFNVTVSFRTYLYNEGNECTSVTGGWGTGWVYGSGYSMTKNETNIVLDARYYDGSSQRAISALTNSTIYVSGYNKLCTLASYNNLTRGYDFGFGLYVGNPANTWPEINNNSTGATAYGTYQFIAYKVTKLITVSENVDFVLTHDFNLSGNQKVSISDYGSGTWTIKKIWLE